MTRGIAATLLALAVAVTLPACTPSTYAGISLRPGAADPELQALARRAQAGDKQAQLDLGIRYEEGRGVLRDLERAEELFLAASTDVGGVRHSYSSAVPGSNGPGVVLTSQGPPRIGIPEARSRWTRLRSQRTVEAVSVTTPSNVNLEVYLARRLAAERQRRNSGVDRIPIRRIVGPVRFSGQISVVMPPQVGGELCDAIGALVKVYRSFGFESCTLRRFVTRAQARGTRHASVYMLYYTDSYADSEEYLSSSLDLPYRPPLSADLSIVSWPVVCGDFNAFDVILTSGKSYRIIIGLADARQQLPGPETCR